MSPIPEETRLTVELPEAPTLDELRTRTTLTVPEGGAVVGLSRTGAYAAAKRGDLPTIRIGRRIVVPVPALLRMLGADTTAGQPGEIAG